MAEMNLMAERTIDAPAAKVYGVIADYQQQHPQILPPAFSDWNVEQGGVGAGTVVAFSVKSGGRNRHFRSQIAEPEPGRVLIESDTESTLVTSYHVDPEGSGSRIRIETTWQRASGFEGLMERLFAPRIMRKLYADELDRLETYVQSNGSQ
jgi:hypothetical protein